MLNLRSESINISYFFEFLSFLFHKNFSSSFFFVNYIFHILKLIYLCAYFILLFTFNFFD